MPPKVERDPEPITSSVAGERLTVSHSATVNKLYHGAIKLYHRRGVAEEIPGLSVGRNREPSNELTAIHHCRNHSAFQLAANIFQAGNSII